MRPTSMARLRVLLVPLLVATAAGCSHAGRTATVPATQHAGGAARPVTAAPSTAGPAAPAPAPTSAANDVPASGGPGAPPGVDPFSAAFPGETYSPHAAALRAERLLTFLSLPAGSTTSRRPSPRLQPAPKSDPRRNLLVRSRFVSVPGSAHHLAALLTSEAVPLQATTSGAGRLVLHRYGSGATIVVTMVQAHDHVAVRIDGEDVWLPHRSPAEFIPWSTPVVELAKAPLAGDGKPQHLLYRGPEVVKLANLLNYATPRPPAPCRTGQPTARTRVTFRIGHRVVTFGWTDDGCDIIKAAVNGRPVTSLTGRVFAGQFVDYLLSGKAK